jgi:hypothetical protein
VGATGWFSVLSQASGTVLGFVRLLDSIGISVVDRFIEWDAPQVMYSVDQATLRTAAASGTRTVKD